MGTDAVRNDSTPGHSPSSLDCNLTFLWHRCWLDDPCTPIGVDLAGILRGMHGERRRPPKVGRCHMGWGIVRSVPSPADYRVWGSVVSSPSGVRGRAPAKNGFWCILKATERSYLYLYDKNLRGTICTSVPLLQILGDLSPWSTPMCTPHCSWPCSSTSTASCTAQWYVLTDCLVGSLTTLFCLCLMLMYYMIYHPWQAHIRTLVHGRQDGRDSRVEKYKH